VQRKLKQKSRENESNDKKWPAKHIMMLEKKLEKP
jgi:hypothetical protein